MRANVIEQPPENYPLVLAKKLFPDYEPNKALRFSRLLGDGSFSNLPHIHSPSHWEEVQKQRRKREEKAVREKLLLEHTTAATKIAVLKKLRRQYNCTPPVPLNKIQEPCKGYPHVLTPDMCVSDDEVQLGDSFILYHFSFK